MRINAVKMLALMALVHPSVSSNKNIRAVQVETKLNVSTPSNEELLDEEEFDEIKHKPGPPQTPPDPPYNPPDPPEFPLQCALYDQLLKQGECNCGPDSLGLCPDTWSEYEIKEFCMSYIGNYHVDESCPFCIETCPFSCMEYVKSCCPCVKEHIVSLEPTMFKGFDEDYQEVHCQGPLKFNECDLPAIIPGIPEISMCLWFSEAFNFFTSGPPPIPANEIPCNLVFPQCFLYYPGQAIWLAISNTVNSMFKIDDHGIGFKVKCNAHAEALILWKATPTVAKIVKENRSGGTAKYEVLLDDGFNGRNKCGTVNYTCHPASAYTGFDGYDIPFSETVMGQEMQDIETEEIGTSWGPGWGYPETYYRDVIKDCCGWFISDKYKMKYRPYKCDREWYRFDPTVIGDHAGKIGEKATPCFTNLEFVGIQVDVMYYCGGGQATRGLQNTTLNEGGLQNTTLYEEDVEDIEALSMDMWEYIDINEEKFIGKAPILACSDCCNENGCSITKNLFYYVTETGE